MVVHRIKKGLSPHSSLAVRNASTGAGQSKYLLISPCRDEAKYIRQTLDSVIGQSIRPAKWVIVDDGSTDRTPQILAEYQSKYPWIEVVTRSNRGRRAVGAGVMDAF